MILITGGSGYLGGRLAEHLCKMQSKKVVYTFKKNIYDFSEILPNCEARFLDITDNETIDQALDGITEVIHLISLNAQDSAADPLMAREINTNGTDSLIQSCVKKSIKRFIYISTAHIYGSPLAGTINEESVPNATHPYSFTHLDAEKIILKKANNTETVPTILRLSNAVGTPLTPNTNCWMLVVNDIIKQLVTTNAMTFTSHSSIERDYVSISQITHTIDYILKAPKSSFEGIYNLGSGKSMTLESLSDLIKKRARLALGFDAPVYFPDDKMNIIEPLYYSISKIEQAGVIIDRNLNNEIDNLIMNSKKWFC
jgi:UDP-glucose 4-epimerase